MSELREGLAKHLYGVIPFGDCTRNDAEALADSVLSYLHDGHAEFVRADGAPVSGNTRGSCFVVYRGHDLGSTRYRHLLRDAMRAT